MKPANILYIMSDEHQQKALGCYGHSFVQTPNIDRLAASGTRFETAYTPSPICVPARASLQTGCYVHEVECWDNCHPYRGTVESWGHILQDNGHHVDSVGKLHFQSEDNSNGFANEIIPLHVFDRGLGSLAGSVKDPLPDGMKKCKLATEIGPGDSGYTNYDRDITAHACQWLRDETKSKSDQPWVLFVSFVCPHYPLIVPQEFYDLYPTDSLPHPKANGDPDYTPHPWIAEQRRNKNQEDFFTNETRRIAMASYYGMISYLDSNIGKVLQTMTDCGFADDTRIIYTSDHGENLAARELWGKSNMYEEAAAIPLIVAGPSIPSGKVSKTPASLLDLFPTFLDGVGLNDALSERDLPGQSLWKLASNSDDPDRVIFSEYYAAGATSATFLIRKGHFKYIHYIGFEPELFDLRSDPEELHNLANDPGHQKTVQEYEKILRGIVDPEATDKQAKISQAALVDQHGGREAVLNLGTVQGTPAPGEEAIFVP